MKQIDLFSDPKNQSTSKFVSIYRVSLVKDKSISFGQGRMNNSKEAQSLIQSLIKTQGQPDSEEQGDAHEFMRFVYRIEIIDALKPIVHLFELPYLPLTGLDPIFPLL